MTSGGATAPALALLAGGRATRLRPIAQDIPKSMVEVAGEPFIAHQLRILGREGIARVVMCVGHLGDQIEAYVGDGGRFGVEVAYSWDGERLLGTGGALRKALPLLGDSFWILYGDSYLDVAFAPVLDAFRASRRPALMTVLRNDDRWDRSNVEYANGVVEVYDKDRRTPGMTYVDFGLSLLRAEALASKPAGEPFELAGLFTDLARRGLLAGHEMGERFYEIGSPAGLAETGRHLGKDA